MEGQLHEEILEEHIIGIDKLQTFGISAGTPLVQTFGN
jgi:hypothetical protein